MNLLLELVHIDLVNLVSFHGILKEGFHVIYLSLMLWITLWGAALLFRHEGFEDLQMAVSIDGLFFLVLFGGSVSIGAIACNDENPE